MDSIALVLLTALVIFLATWTWHRAQNRLPYPPGPRGLPIIGNVLDLPSDRNLAAWSLWGQEFGTDVVHLRMLNTHLVVVNSAKAAHQILDRNGKYSSDRPFSPMLELTGSTWSFVVWNGNTPEFRSARKLFTQLLAPSTNATVSGSNDAGVHAASAVNALLRELLATPELFYELSKFVIARWTVSLAYGIKTRAEDDPYLLLQERGTQAFFELSQPGAFLVDVFPILRYVPGWFPGATFKKKAARWRVDVLAARDVPLDASLAAAKEGKLMPCIVQDYLQDVAEKEDGRLSPEEWTQIAGTAATVYAAGIETTSASIQTFFLAMTLYPDIQRLAQAELDSLLKGVRLPMLTDQSSLPYISAVITELLRWETSLPLGLPHLTSKDIIHDGCYIPAKSVIFGNIWAMLRDPQTYPNPTTFDPSRFLGPTPQPDPSAAFGFGKRICPGRHAARDMIFLTVASVLTCFEISGATGTEPRFVSKGITRRPEKFSCNVKPRTEAWAQLVRDTDDGE